MNKNIINILSQQVNDYKNDSSKRWKAKALEKALYSIKEYPSKITSGKDVASLKGIGKGIIKRIDEIIKTGTLSGLSMKDSSKNDYINKIKLFKEITGVGDARAKSWIKSGLNTIEDVFNAKNNGNLKTTHHIDVGLKYFYDFKKRIPRKEIEKMKLILEKNINKVNNKLIFEVCGSFRRGQNDSGDIDVLVTCKGLTTEIKEYSFLSKLVKLLKKDNFIIDDLTKSGEKKYMGVCKLKSNLPARRIDIRCVNYDEYYSSLLYFTGSKNFNVLMRQNAIDMNYSLNEYGLKNKKNGELMKLNSEEELFKILNVPYMNPEDRNI